MTDTREWADTHGETRMTRSQFEREEQREQCFLCGGSIDAEGYCRACDVFTFDAMAEQLKERDDSPIAESALEAPREFTIKFSSDELDWLLGELLPALVLQKQAVGDHPEANDIECSIRLWDRQVREQGYVGGND